MNKNLAITVLTWNDWENTTKCLESIFQSSYEYFDVILVDNNSDELHMNKIYEWANNNLKVEDEEIEFNPNKKIEIIKVTENLKLSKRGERKIYLISSKKRKNERWSINLGCTAGVNLGYNFSLKHDYDYIARIDCDLVITKNYIESMINMLEKNPDIAAASPKIIHGYLKNTIWWAGFKINPFYLKFQKTMNLKKKRIIDNDSLNGIIYSDVVSGCCSFYRSEILKKTGVGDEDFFFGPEDTELSHRIKKFGKIAVNLDVKTFHKITSSSKVSGWLSRSYYETKGFLLLIKKTGNWADKLIGYPYFILRIPYFLILMIFKLREKDRVIGFYLGCLDFFFKKKSK
tara:strand:+ start:287 stop:1321 length:1035 start_codon:yes stop_codon:yes gene_type:complete